MGGEEFQPCVIGAVNYGAAKATPSAWAARKSHPGSSARSCSAQEKPHMPHGAERNPSPGSSARSCRRSKSDTPGWRTRNSSPGSSARSWRAPQKRNRQHRRRGVPAPNYRRRDAAGITRRAHQDGICAGGIGPLRRLRERPTNRRQPTPSRQHPRQGIGSAWCLPRSLRNALGRGNSRHVVTYQKQKSTAQATPPITPAFDATTGCPHARSP